MPDKKTFNTEEKAEALQSFGKTLNDKSLRIIEALEAEFGSNPKKDLNKLLKKAYKYRNYVRA